MPSGNFTEAEYVEMQDLAKDEVMDTAIDFFRKIWGIQGISREQFARIAASAHRSSRMMPYDTASKYSKENTLRALRMAGT